MDFKDYYKLPLHICDYCEAYIYTDDENMAAMSPWIDGKFDKGFAYSVVSVINGEIEPANVPGLSGRKFVYSDQGAKIKDPETGKTFMLIRGWGRLTGGLSLPKETAIKIQDQFGEYIVNQLNR